MLLDENPLVELTDEDGTNLVRLLSASVKKAVGERIVPATDTRKLYYNKAQKVSYKLVFILLNFNSQKVSSYQLSFIMVF